ncbi:aldose 1-epimerase [Candidatus Poribacteria bacterium]|nr:aldose 1-epimerase [Candidatus Poribacteria bacterium]
MADSQYSIEKKQVDSFEIYALKHEGKAVAKVVPALGNNCFVYSVSYQNAWYDLIDPPPHLSTLEQRPTAFGNPILFPFPNRIRDGKWEFEGKTYQFDKSSDSPTTIHGLLLNRPYTVDASFIESTTSDFNQPRGAILKCSLNSVEFPDVIRQYPFPFKIEITYALHDSVLSMYTTIVNIGETNMPMGYGIHPYFNVNISGTANAQDALISVPANTYWELDDVLVPTGAVLDVTGTLDLRDGQPFGKIKLDHVFTDVQVVDGVSRCSIVNQDTGYGMVMESDSIFRELVVYTPPGRDAICFEPYTCPTDAINLESKGIPAGVIVLSPKESFSTLVRFVPTYTPQL